MSYIITTDKVRTEGAGLPGSTDPKTGLIWGTGIRFYYCGEAESAPHFAWAFSDAVRFKTWEAAEIRYLILCILSPDLIDHGHIMEEAAALKEWEADLQEYIERSNIEIRRRLRRGP